MTKIIDALSLSSSENELNDLVSWSKNQSVKPIEVASLAQKLARSGELVSLPDETVCVDIPSTGGPSSLSTLLCPIILRQMNLTVSKLGVKGRPAGGIDSLSLIRNYKINWHKNEIEECLKRHKYCHFIADENQAPLDAMLFRFRTRIGAKAIPSLVVASILSKKIAAGVNVVGLDVRVSKFGNFGTDWESARRNSLLFKDVSSHLGIKASCFLSDFSSLDQPYIGRGESLLALSKIFFEKDSLWLNRHLQKCVNMCASLTEEKLDLAELMSGKNLYGHFEANVKAQNGDLISFLEIVSEIEKGHTNELVAKESGFLQIDIETLRDSIVAFQEEIEKVSLGFSDPCGVVFFKNSNEFVEKGEAILSYRAEPEIKALFKEQISKLVAISDAMSNGVSYEKI
jgi:thymidine phosphorylase